MMPVWGIIKATADNRPAAKEIYIRRDREPVGPNGKDCRRSRVDEPVTFWDTSLCSRSRRSEAMLVLANEARKRKIRDITKIMIGNNGPLLSLSISGYHVLLM